MVYSYTMARGTVTITTSSAHHITRGMVLTTSGSSGEVQNFYVIGVKTPTELYVASSWRESLWVPWFQVTGWLRSTWMSMRFWVLKRFGLLATYSWEKWQPVEKVPPHDKVERVFVNDDSEPEVGRPDPKNPRDWN